MKTIAIALLVILMTTVGCTNRPSVANAVTSTKGLTTDSTIYGLACEECNDTIVVFLRQPYDGSDPDTLNVFEAKRRQQVFGSIRPGDQLAIMCNADDSTVADIVIVTQDLLGRWCYKVRPTPKRRAEHDSLTQEQIAERLPDSIRRMLSVEREYGFTLKIDSVAFPIWTNDINNNDNNLPVEYPPITLYRQWYISNGKLMLVQSITDSVGNNQVLGQDTAQLVRLTADTLVLRFSNGEQSYYRNDATDNQP